MDSNHILRVKWKLCGERQKVWQLTQYILMFRINWSVKFVFVCSLTLHRCCLLIPSNKMAETAKRKHKNYTAEITLWYWGLWMIKHYTIIMNSIHIGRSVDPSIHYVFVFFLSSLMKFDMFTLIPLCSELLVDVFLMSSAT